MHSTQVEAMPVLGRKPDEENGKAKLISTLAHCGRWFNKVAPPLDLTRRIYEATRAGIIHLARQHYDRSGHLEFVHSNQELGR